MNSRTFNDSKIEDVLHATKKENLVEILLTGKEYMLSRQQVQEDISGLRINRIVQYAHLPPDDLFRASDPIQLMGGRYAFQTDPSYPCIFTPRKVVSQHLH
jgi:hypothetical protein